METTYLLRRTFSAGHAHQVCGDRPHGHDFVVEISVPEKFSSTADGPLDATVLELHGRSLEEMIPGVPPTVAGIARFMFERFRLELAVRRVVVWQSGEIGAEVTDTQL